MGLPRPPNGARSPSTRGNPSAHSVLRNPRAKETPRPACYTSASQNPMDCATCQMSDQDHHLNKCPICFKWVCDGCAVHSFGRLFCSKKCSDQFFFGDDDE